MAPPALAAWMSSTASMIFTYPVQRHRSQLPALVAFQAVADAAVFGHRRHGTTGFGRLDEFDRVDDLHIPGAAAQISAPRPGSVSGGGRRRRLRSPPAWHHRLWPPG